MIPQIFTKTLPNNQNEQSTAIPKVDGEILFNTCKYRSEQPEERTINRCQCQGGPYVDSGFVCSSRQIFKVTKEVCEICPIYQPK